MADYIGMINDSTFPLKPSHRKNSEMLPPSPSLLPASLFLAVFLLLLQIIVIMIECLKRKRSAIVVPPSPPELFLIGHLHLLGSLPHRSLYALSPKYGPVMSLRLGFIPTLVISSPEAAKEILKTHDRTFASRPPSKAAKIIFDDTLELAFAPYSDYWRQQRKLCSTHLLSTKKVQSYKLVREKEVAFMMGKISPGQVVNVSKLLYTFAVDAVTRIVAGTNFREKGWDEAFRILSQENNRAFNAFFLEDWFPSFGWLDQVLGLSKSAMSTRKKWDAALEVMIEEHADRLKDEGEEMDFVDSLLLYKPDPMIITKKQMKALLIEMFAAGSLTTYAALEWAMTELVRNPRVLRILQDEVRGICKDKNGVIQDEELGRMPHLKAVLKEVLRLHPVAPLLIPHESTEDCEVLGYHIPKKTRVFINAWAIGRDPNHWEGADEFRPERFLNAGAIRDFVDDDFRYFPFGAGRRICPGLNFAVCNMELALANLVHRFDWELPPGLTAAEIDMTEADGLVIPKKEALHLVAKPPAGSAAASIHNN